MNPNIGENIKKLRAEKQVTQEQLAEHLCISYQAVSKWENNVTTPDIFLLSKIAEYFEVPIDEIFKVNMKGYKNKAARFFSLYLYCDREQKKENFIKSDNEYEKLIAENKMDGEDMHNYGMLNQFYAQELNKKAEMFLNQAVEAGQNANGQLIMLLESQGRKQESIDKYEELLKNDPDNIRWWNLLISAYGYYGSHDEKGLELVKKGLEKFPNEWGFLYRYAEMLRTQKNYGEAEIYFRKAIAINPDTGECYYNMAFMFSEIKKYKEAVWAWEQVIALHDRLDMCDEEKEMGKEWPKKEIAKLQGLLEQ